MYIVHAILGREASIFYFFFFMVGPRQTGWYFQGDFRATQGPGLLKIMFLKCFAYFLAHLSCQLE